MTFLVKHCFLRPNISGYENKDKKYKRRSRFIDFQTSDKSLGLPLKILEFCAKKNRDLRMGQWKCFTQDRVIFLHH